MTAEVVTVLVDGVKYTAWKALCLRAAVKEACRSASLTIAAESGAAATHRKFELFKPLKVYAGSDLVLDGYIDARAPHMGPMEAQIVVRIRAKGQDAVDCSCVHSTHEIRNKDPLEIAKELDKFGVGFSSQAELKKIPLFRVTKGETLFCAVERACRDQGLTLAGKADGGIDLWNAKAGLKRHKGGLVEGDNIKVVSAVHDGSNRHSEIYVHGQSYEKHGPQAQQIEGKALDATVPRYRPLILAHDGETDKTRAEGKARTRRDRAAGMGISATVLTPSWRDEAGTLWTPGLRVWVESEFADITQDMLLEAVDFKQGSDGEGTEAQLHLVDPRAHGGKAGKQNKSGKGWGMPG